MPTKTPSEFTLLAIAAIAAILIIIFAAYNNSTTGEASSSNRPQKCGNLVCNKGETASSCSADCACGTSGNGAKTWLGNNACCSGLYNSNGVCCPTNTVWNSATQTCETPPSDTAAPVRSNGGPTGTLPAGTATATLSLATNEAATCKYGTVANTPYDSLTRTFATSGGQSHTASVATANGQTYTYYVRCSDTAANKNTDDYTITFGVGQGCTDTTWTPDPATLCGTVTQTSNCGNTRQTAGTVTCTSPNTCGGNGTANQCGCSDTTWSPALTNLCGAVTQTSNCGQTRTQQGAITCQPGQSCTNNQCVATVQGVQISPGQNIQSIMNANPAGTTFILKAGVHRLQTITPRNGDKIIGEAGAVLSGAKIITPTLVNGRWVATGQTQQGQVYGSCESDSPLCNYPEDLFVDGTILKRVASVSALTTGTWFFDYAADTIYLYDNPTGRVVETSVTRNAIVGSAASVTIQNLTIEKYASLAQEGALQGTATTNWIVRDNTFKYNHGMAARIGNGMQFKNNKVLYSGQLGLGGIGDDVVVDGNEIAYNNNLGYAMDWEAGGTKFVRTNRLLVKNNFVHHNRGVGLWTDIENENTVYEYNRVEDNAREGIAHEISYSAIIRYNQVSRNGFTDPRWYLWNAGIGVHASKNVEVYGNTLNGNKNGIVGVRQNRDQDCINYNCKYPPYTVENLYVHDNNVTQTLTPPPNECNYAGGVADDTGDTSVFTSRNNRWQNNHYILGVCQTAFPWQNAGRTAAQWQAYGQDTTGTFSRGDTCNLLTDKVSHAQPALAKPGYLQSTTDPVFGTSITRITGDPGTPIGNGVPGTWPSIIRHEYAKVEPWSADGKLFYVSVTSGAGGANGAQLFLDGQTYVPLFWRTHPGPEARWHPTIPDVMIYVAADGSVGHWNARTNAATIKYQASGYSDALMGDYEGNPSYDGKYVVVYAKRSSDSKLVVYAVDIDSGTKFPDIDLAAQGVSQMDWASISALGNYVVVLGVIDGGGQRTKVFTKQGALVNYLSTVPVGHADLGVDQAGNDVLFSAASGGAYNNRFLMYQLSNGVVTPLSAPYTYDWHSSTRSYNHRGWAVASTNMASGSAVDNEIDMFKLDGTQTMIRLAHHRNVNTGFQTPVGGVPSPDGKRVAFSSNWGSTSGTPMQEYVIDTTAVCAALP